MRFRFVRQGSRAIRKRYRRFRPYGSSRRWGYRGRNRSYGYRSYRYSQYRNGGRRRSYASSRKKRYPGFWDIIARGILSNVGEWRVPSRRYRGYGAAVEPDEEMNDAAPYPRAWGPPEEYEDDPVEIDELEAEGNDRGYPVPRVDDDL